MAPISGEQWNQQQAEVWGTKDPETFGRVIQRIQRQEPEVLAEVERMMRERVPAHALLRYVTNSIIRGVDRVEYGPPAETDTNCAETGGRT